MHLRIPRETRKKGYHPAATAPRKLGDRPKTMEFEGFGVLLQLCGAQNRRGVVVFSCFTRFLQDILRIDPKYCKDRSATRCHSTLSENILPKTGSEAASLPVILGLVNF